MSVISTNVCDQNSGQATGVSLGTIISFFASAEQLVSTHFSVSLIFCLL